MQPLTDEQKQVVADAFPAAIAQAKGISRNKGMEFGIALSGVCFGYIDAIQRWNAEHGTAFTSFAHHRGRYQLIEDGRLHNRWLKAPRGKQPRMSSLDAVSTNRTGGEDSGASFGSYERSACDPSTVDERDAFEARIACLDDRKKLILRLMYLEGLNLREIGESLGCDESRVSQLRKEAFATLKASMQ